MSLTLGKPSLTFPVLVAIRKRMGKRIVSPLREMTGGWELWELNCLDETSTLVLLMKTDYVSTLRTILLLIYFSDFCFIVY